MRWWPGRDSRPEPERPGDREPLPAGGDEESPDEALELLNVGGARRLRALVVEAFAHQGIEVVPHPGYVEDASGLQYGLWNLSARVGAENPDGWPSLVADHVERMLALGRDQDPAADLSAPEVGAAFLARVYWRLLAESDVPADHPGLRVGPLPGLVSLLSRTSRSTCEAWTTTPSASWVRRSWTQQPGATCGP